MLFQVLQVLTTQEAEHMLEVLGFQLLVAFVPYLAFACFSLQRVKTNTRMCLRVPLHTSWEMYEVVDGAALSPPILTSN